MGVDINLYAECDPSDEYLTAVAWVRLEAAMPGEGA